MTVNSNPYSVVAIGNTALRLLSFQGQPVITLSMMDQAHERPEGTAGRNFRENKERLVEGEDYFRRISSEAKTEFDITAPNGLTLLTQSGYLMLVKSFTDDLSWKVQRQLVDGYFGYRKPKEPTIAQQMAVHKMRLSLLDRLQRETHPGQGQNRRRCRPAPAAASGGFPPKPCSVAGRVGRGMPDPRNRPLDPHRHRREQRRHPPLSPLPPVVPGQRRRIHDAAALPRRTGRHPPRRRSRSHRNPPRNRTGTPRHPHQIGRRAGRHVRS